jgi:hypothetical protein
MSGAPINTYIVFYRGKEIKAQEGNAVIGVSGIAGIFFVWMISSTFLAADYSKRMFVPDG